MRNKSIKINAILNGIRTILNLIFPLITFPYVSRVLSVNEIGKYNFSSSIVTYFLLIAALGIDKYAIREGAKYRNDRDKISKFASKVFSLNLISMLISYLLLFVFLIFSKKVSGYQICIIIFSIQIFFTTIGTEWIYTIFEEYSYITIRSIIFKVISIVLLFIFVRKEGDYLAYAGVTVFASVGSNVLNIINSKKYCTIKITFKLEWKDLVKPVLIIFASNIAIQIYINSDITMLGYLKNDYLVGIYSVSTRIYLIIKNALMAVLTVTVPRLSLYAGKKMKNEYSILLSKVTNTLIILILPAIIGLILLSQNIVLIIASDKYITARISLIILSFAIVFSIFSTLFNQCVLLPYKRESVFLKSSIVSALLNIILNFLMIPLWGEIGAAITTVLAELSMALLNYIGSKDIINGMLFNKSFLKNSYSVVIGSVGVAIVCIFSCRNVSGLWMQTLIAILGSVILYGVLLVVLKNEIILDSIHGLKRKIK